jgi:hypothetical protein
VAADAGANHSLGGALMTFATRRQRPASISTRFINTMNVLLREPCGVDWCGQWLRLENAPDSHHLMDVSDGREIPFQILQDGTALCRVDLPASQTLQLEWQRGASTPSIKHAARLIANEKEITLSNGLLEARLPLAFFAGARTPLLTVHRAGEESDVAAVRYEGAARDGSTRALENGPLCTRVEISLQCDDGVYGFDVELLADESFLRMRENFRGGRSSKGKVARLVCDLTDFKARDFFCDGWPGTETTLRDARSFAQRFGVESGVLAALGAQTVFGQVGAPWAIVGDGATALGAIVVGGGDWECPGEVALRLRRTESGLEISGDADEGSREWLLLCGAQNDWFPREGESATQVSSLKSRGDDLSLDKIRHWQLDAREPMRPVVWTDTEGVLAAHERLQAPQWSGLLESIPHRTLQGHSFDEHESSCFGLCGTTDSFPDGVLWLQSGDEAAGRKLAVQIRAWVEGAARRFAAGLLGAGLDCVALRPFKLCVYWHDALRGSNLQTEEDAARTRRALLFCAHCMSERDYFDWQSATAAPASPHSMRRFLLEEDYSDKLGCYNFHSDIYTAIGSVGLAFPDHPSAQAWIEHAETMALHDLENHVAPDGTYVESDNYYQHFLGLIYYLGFALHRIGRDAIVNHPRLHAGLEYWIRAQTPPLRRTSSPATSWFGTYCENPEARPISQMLPLGDCGLNWGGQALPPFLHHAANFYADKEPPLASHLEWAWQRAGRPLAQYSFLVQEMLTQRLEGPTPREYSLRSCELQGHGALLRADVNTPRETALLISGGRATSHMHWDSGGLQLWYAGAPVIVDSGYVHDEFTATREYGGARWKHSTLTFGEWGNELGAGDWGLEHRAPLCATQFEAEFDYVEVELSHGNRRGATWRDITRLVSIEAQRGVLFAKGRYLVVRDRIARSVYPATWHLWTLSTGEEIEANRVRIRGRFGIDLAVTFLQPDAPRVHVEEYSAARHLWINQNPTHDFLVVLQPLLSNEKPHHIEAAKHGAMISGEDWMDEISFDPPTSSCQVCRNRQMVFSSP